MPDMNVNYPYNEKEFRKDNAAIQLSCEPG
jgi:hypothetical protein